MNKKATREDLKGILNTIYHKAEKLLIRKNDDYASSDDIFRNFEAIAELCKHYNVDVTTRVGVKQFFVIVKFDRYMKMDVQSTEPKNESLLDTIVDELNYLVIGEGMRLEK